jgi:hypothetical protein
LKKQKYFHLLSKNALAYYSAGVAAVNSKVAGLAPGEKLVVRKRPLATLNQIPSRAARFFAIQYTKTGGGYSNLPVNY